MFRTPTKLMAIYVGFLITFAWGTANSVAFASENERYKAIPMAAGGYVFILDTREGHAWTWSSGGTGGASANGVNPHIVYQGNVRQNMKGSATAIQSPQDGKKNKRF